MLIYYVLVSTHSSCAMISPASFSRFIDNCTQGVQNTTTALLLQPSFMHFISAIQGNNACRIKMNVIIIYNK